VGEGGGSSGGVGLPIIEIIKLFSGAEQRSQAEKAVRNFERALRENPDLTPEQAVQATDLRTRRQFFNQQRPVAEAAGVSVADFLLRFIPEVTFLATEVGAKGGRSRRAALRIPNINRLAAIQLGLAEPIAPRRTERPGRPIVGPLDIARWLAILAESIFGRQPVFGRAEPRRAPPVRLPPSRQTLPRQRRPVFDPFGRIQLPGGFNVPLVDSITEIFGALGGLARDVSPILRDFGVLPPLPPVVGTQAGLTNAQLIALGLGSTQQAGAGAALGALGGFIRRQLPGIAAGVAGGELVEGLGAVGGQAPAACITPVTRTSTRLPRTVDVPVSDSAGNVHVRTYVKAPRVRYGVPIISSSRKRRGCR